MPANDSKVASLDPESAVERQNILNQRIMSEIDLMSKEALAYLKSNFETELWELRIDEATRAELRSAAQPDDRLEIFKRHIRNKLLPFLLLENLTVDVDNMLSQKLEAVCSDDGKHDSKPQRPLLEQLFEGMDKPQNLFGMNKQQLAAVASKTQNLDSKPLSNPESLLQQAQKGLTSSATSFIKR